MIKLFHLRTMKGFVLRFHKLNFILLKIASTFRIMKSQKK